jgi:hypothetical protein
MSCLTWPFVMLWKLLAGVIKLTGRLVAVLTGLVLLAAGIVLCFTVIGMIAGIPSCVLGLLLIVRGLF